MRPTSAETIGSGGTAAPTALKPQDALDAAIDAARIAAPLVETLDGRLFAFVSRNHDLKDISDPHRIQPRPIQSVTFDDRDSQTAYVNRFSDARSVLIADFNQLEVQAVLDWHPHNAMKGEHGKAGPRQHRAVLKLLPSEEFARWDAFEGELHSQEEFAAFLEENSVDIATPEAAVMVEISRDLEATQSIGYKSSVRLENGDRKFTYEGETRVQNDVVVPREFVLIIPIYNGEDPVDLRCALRFRPTAGGVRLGFEWRRVEYQRRAHFGQIAAAVAEATGLPVFLGRAS